VAKLNLSLKWHGGKYYLASKFVALMPPHLHYVEPYFGGGAVLFAHDPHRDWLLQDGKKLPCHLRGVSEVANDVNGELMNFWSVLRDEASFDRFQRAVAATPFSEAAFQQACRPYDASRPVESAVDFFVRNRQSLAGRMRHFTGITKTRTRRLMNNDVSAWLSCLEGLPAVHSRLKRVVLLQRDAIYVIRNHDTPNTLFYCDPPYLHETRATADVYAFEMSEADHAELLETLSKLKGKFMLSGYRNDMYEEAERRLGWRRLEFELPNNASCAKAKGREIECLWMNFGKHGPRRPSG
jgi:DNA adenine methylase